MAEDPGVVFSVKELIGRLDGKLDVVLNTLSGKASREDVQSLDRRLGVVEEKVTGMQQRDLARTAANAAEEKVEKEHEDRHRWKLGAIIAMVAALASFGALVVMIITIKGH